MSRAAAVLSVLLAVVLLSSSGESRRATADTSLSWCGDNSSLVVIGDSMSSGHGAADPDNAWVQRIAQAFPSTAVTNLSRNGALVSDFLPDGVGVQPRPSGNLAPDTVQQVQTIQPSLVIVALGANEYGTDRDPAATFQANLQDLTDRIQAASPDSTLLYVHTTGFDYRWASGSALPIDFEWSDYGAAMQSLATVEGGGYLDLTKFLPWADQDTAGLFVVDEFGAGNTVHWADAGHVAAGGVIHQQLLMC